LAGPIRYTSENPRLASSPLARTRRIYSRTQAEMRAALAAAAAATAVAAPYPARLLLLSARPRFGGSSILPPPIPFGILPHLRSGSVRRPRVVARSREVRFGRRNPGVYVEFVPTGSGDLEGMVDYLVVGLLRDSESRTLCLKLVSRRSGLPL
jgi:hypothetical protein